MQSGRWWGWWLASTLAVAAAYGWAEPAGTQDVTQAAGASAAAAPADTTDALPLVQVQPRYPEGARHRGEEGIVAVHVSIDAQGHVADAVVVMPSKFPALDAAALRAARQARFAQPASNAAPVSCQTTMTFRFKLVD